MNFNETELGVISNALRVAAEHFQANASELQANYGNAVGQGMEGLCRLSEQFGRQAHEAQKLYDAIVTKTGIAS